MQTLIKALLVFVCFFSIGCADQTDTKRTTIDTVDFKGSTKQPIVSAYYYGSPDFLNVIKPKTYIKHDIDGNKIYHSNVVRAFTDKRLALLYSTNYVPGMSIGADLLDCRHINEPIRFTLIGGRSEANALDKLFGKEDDLKESIGYIYILEQDGFAKESGLGCMEAVAHKGISNWKVEKLNRREALNKYIVKGLVTIEWLPST